MRDGEPTRPLSAVLGAALRRDGLELVLAPRAWERAAGPVLARHVQPVAVRGETLVLRADAPAWCEEVRALQARLLPRLAAEGLPVERLEVQAPPARGRARRGP